MTEEQPEKKPTPDMEASIAPAEASAPKTNDTKKRKVCMFLAYVGHGYQGMQRNPGAKTIEEDLFNAIHAAGGISDANADDKGPSKVHWMRAARTDKGVSAVGQVVSFKMILNPPGMVERINANLPDQIRVFGFYRVTNGFDSRKHCDKRRYEYILPTWAFAPQGTAVEDFTFDDACVQKLSEILGQYKGTHNFHNYTIRTSHHAPDVRRYILSFGCEGVMTIKGKEWVRMVVVGQSFMLHQIRKMIGMAVSVFKGIAPEGCLKLALDTKASLNVPMAPELGLFLDSCYFESYSKHWGHQHGAISSQPYAPAMDAFKTELLYPHIANRDLEEGVNAEWFQTLTEENYRFSKWEQFAAENKPRSGLTMADKKRTAKLPMDSAKRRKNEEWPNQQPDLTAKPEAAVAAVVNGGGATEVYNPEYSE